MRDYVMNVRGYGLAGWAAFCVLMVAGCQGFPGLENASAAPKVSADPNVTSSEGHAKPAAKPVVVTTPAPVEVPPPAPLPVLQVDAAMVASGIVVPPLADHDSHADALANEKAQVDLMISQGALTREAGAKRLYRFASKNGLLKGKADEEFWQSLIQAYRNLDDRFIAPEDAATDINAAAQRRAAALK
jgi:hypothetical protein